MTTLKELRRHLAMVLSQRDYDRDGFKRAVEEYFGEHPHLDRIYESRAKRPMLGWRRFVEECWKDYCDWRSFKVARQALAGTKEGR